MVRWTSGQRRHLQLESVGRSLPFVAATCVLLPRTAVAQGLTGALIGTVKDDQGGVLPGADVRVELPGADWRPGDADHEREGATALPGSASGTRTCSTSSSRGLRRYHEEDIRIGAGATIERTAVLKLAGVAESIVVEGAGSRIEARDPGFGTRFGPEDLKAIPTRRASMFDFIRAAPGISPTSPSSGTATTVSAFGSGTNENQFLIDGTNFTCPCNGIARAEPGIDFIQEVQVQSVGASAEYGNIQGAVINVVTRQGSDAVSVRRVVLRADGRPDQPAGAARVARPGDRQSGYERVQVPRLDDEPGRSCCSRSAVVLRGIPVSARLRQSARHRSEHSREPTSRTRSSRSSRGDWPRAGSWCKAFTTSSGSTPNNRRS